MQSVMATATVVQPAVLFLLSLLLLASGSAGAGVGRKLVFLLAGQSNMSGRGGATNGTWDGVVPPECASSPRILRLSPDLRWEEAREPLHAGIDVGNILGVGPGMPFAHSYIAEAGLLRAIFGLEVSTSKETSLKLPIGGRGRVIDVKWIQRDPLDGSSNNSEHAIPPEAAVGLVPCAQGATPIANWSRGTDLYERMVTRARAALECDGELAAMLWFQGETDAMKREDAELYQGRMEALVRDVRRDLNSPDLLVIEVGIATAQYGGKFLNSVREAQRAVSSRLRHVKFVDAMGLPIADDKTHLTTQAQIQLGNMLANAYLAKQ